MHFIENPIIENKALSLTDRGGGVVWSSQDVDCELLLNSVISCIKAIVVLVAGDYCKNDY